MLGGGASANPIDIRCAGSTREGRPPIGGLATSGVGEPETCGGDGGGGGASLASSVGMGGSGSAAKGILEVRLARSWLS